MGLIKFKEAQKIGSTINDSDGRLISKTSLKFKDIYINSDHIVSVNEELEGSRTAAEPICRIETTRGVFVVSGDPNSVNDKICSEQIKVKPKQILKD